MNRVVENKIDHLSPTQGHSRVSTEVETSVVPAAVKLGVILFVAFTIGAEIITMYVGVIPGAILYGLLLVGLTNLAYFSHTSVARRISLAFTLLPLLRILSLTVPIKQLPLIYQYVMTGVPLLLSTILVIRAIGLPSLRLNLSGMEWLYQVVIGMSGIPLGVIAAVTLVPPPAMINTPNLFGMFLLWVAYTIFGAVMEEIIFRGLVQKSISYPFGFFTVFLSSILYATMFLGTLSPGYIIFYGLTGLLFSIWVQLSDSIFGVILAHSLMNIVFLLFFYLF